MRVAFARRDDNGWDLFAIDLRDLQPVLARLAEQVEYVGHPAWWPDGSEIALEMEVQDDTEIVVLDVESGQIAILIDRSGHDRVPAWSLDGQRLVCGGQPDGTGEWDIWSLDVTSGAINRLTTHVDVGGGAGGGPGVGD
jgi:TolB protein